MTTDDRGGEPPALQTEDRDHATTAEVEDAGMVRAEEELVLDTRIVPRERVRLVKRVVTETVTTTTELRREELHIERVALDKDEPASAPPADASASKGTPTSATPAGAGDRRSGRMRERLTSLQQRARVAGTAMRGRSFEDETIEITLVEEQVVVTKRVVPRERIRLRKHTITDQRPVTETVRKEQAELKRDRLTDADSVQPRTADRASTPGS